MAKTPRKLQILTELLSEEKVLQLIAEQLGQFVVIGPDEPDHGPCLWFDTSKTVSGGDDDDTPTQDPVIYLILDSNTDASDTLAEIDGVEYAVLNADTPILADDGESVIINVG